MNVLLSFHTDAKTCQGKKQQQQANKERIRKSTIHPSVIWLLPGETHNPESLTEIKFFLLETNMWL